MLSKSLAMSLMMSPCWVGWVCSSFLITTTLSATTVSAKAAEHISQQNSERVRHDASDTDFASLPSLKLPRQRRVFTVSVGQQQHQAAQTRVRHLGDVGGAAADGLDGGGRKRLVLALHVGLQVEAEGTRTGRRGGRNSSTGGPKKALSVAYTTS